MHEFMREFAHEFVDEFFANFVHELKYEIRRNFLHQKLVMLRMACTVRHCVNSKNLHELLGFDHFQGMG